MVSAGRLNGHGTLKRYIPKSIDRVAVVPAGSGDKENPRYESEAWAQYERLAVYVRTSQPAIVKNPAYIAFSTAQGLKPYLPRILAQKDGVSFNIRSVRDHWKSGDIGISAALTDSLTYSLRGETGHVTQRSKGSVFFLGERDECGTLVLDQVIPAEPENKRKQGFYYVNLACLLSGRHQGLGDVPRYKDGCSQCALLCPMVLR